MIVLSFACRVLQLSLRADASSSGGVNAVWGWLQVRIAESLWSTAISLSETSNDCQHQYWSLVPLFIWSILSH
jgi:hypothetical protein